MRPLREIIVLLLMGWAVIFYLAGVLERHIFGDTPAAILSWEVMTALLVGTVVTIALSRDSLS